MPSLPCAWAASRGVRAGQRQEAEAGPGNRGLTPGARQPLPARAGGDGIWQEASCFVSKHHFMLHFKGFSCPFPGCLTMAGSVLVRVSCPFQEDCEEGAEAGERVVHRKLLGPAPPRPGPSACGAVSHVSLS